MIGQALLLKPHRNEKQQQSSVETQPHRNEKQQQQPVVENPPEMSAMELAFKQALENSKRNK